MIEKICRYLSRLDGVEVAKTNDSGSHYFNAPGVKIRVSDHIAYSFNPTTTLNIVCDTKTESFVVFYGSRIIPIQTYAQLRELLRNFVMVCDVLAPLADIRRPKYVDRVVTIEKPMVVAQSATPTPTKASHSGWIYVGDLPVARQKGAQSMVDNMRKMAAASKKKK